MKVKIVGFEEQIQKFYVPPEVQVETLMPVMPIKRDKAMAALTETEIAVLEMLSSEGPKTAPEIKEQVTAKQRTHCETDEETLRRRILEREVGKIPFKYTSKKRWKSCLRNRKPPSITH